MRTGASTRRALTRFIASNRRSLGIGRSVLTGSGRSVPAARTVVVRVRETEIPGVFACGNVLHVHDLVDFVSEEAHLAGESAAKWVLSGAAERAERSIPVRASGKVRYTVPQRIESPEAPVRLFFRVGSVADNAVLTVKSGQTVLATKKKRRMTPGEMESFELSPAVLRTAFDAGEALTVSVD